MKVQLSGTRREKYTPLRLTDLPEEVADIYESINEYLRQAKISCRYQNTSLPDPWPPNLIRKTKQQVSADIVRNRSVTSSEHNLSPLKWPDHPSRRLKLAIGTPITLDVRAQAYKMARDVLNDPYGCTKTAGLRIPSVHGEVFVPLWSCGFIAINRQRFQDREIKWITTARGLPPKTSSELQEIMLIHTFIEAGWWAPAENRRPSSDDNERLISLVVTETLPLFPIETLRIFDKLTFIEQHYQHKEREHLAVQCPCERLKDPTTSFLMQKVSKLRDFLVYEAKYQGTTTLQFLPTIKAGPSLTLRRTLAAVARRAQADLAATPEAGTIV